MKNISQFPELIKQLKISFYVDDLVTGVTDGIQFFKRSRDIIAAGGKNLRKWKSNSHELMKKFNTTMSSQEQKSSPMVISAVEEEDESYAGAVTGHCVTNVDQLSKILRVIWDHNTDTFRFNFTPLESYVNSESVTKRVILRLTAKI